MISAFFYIIIIILVFDYFLERFLEWLNAKNWSDVLPESLKGIYDEEKYAKAQRYEKAKRRFSFISNTVNFVLMISFLSFGGFAWIDNYIRVYTSSPIPLALSFFGVIALATSLISLPFEVYHTFVIEEKFGFNKTTVKTFILDKLKGILIAIVIGGGLISLIVWIYGNTGDYFWLFTWAVLAFFMIFLTMFYSNLIVPFFNKQKPLESGPLRDAIESFATKVGFSLKNIYVIDGSKRSSKSNAYFTGLGGKKRIVLYDTLINDHTNEELVAVLAHEIGHYKKHHTLVGMILGLLQSGLMLFILSLFISPSNPLSQALCQGMSGISGIEVKQSFHLGVMAFGILYSPLSLIIGLLVNILSRSNEYAADRYAGVNYSSVHLKEALKKLSVNNLSNLMPHPAYVFFYYSHPTLLQRLEALDEL